MTLEIKGFFGLPSPPVGVTKFACGLQCGLIFSRHHEFCPRFGWDVCRRNPHAPNPHKALNRKIIEAMKSKILVVVLP
jgi:hypothetical protein